MYKIKNIKILLKIMYKYPQKKKNTKKMYVKLLSIQAHVQLL